MIDTSISLAEEQQESVIVNDVDPSAETNDDNCLKQPVIPNDNLSSLVSPGGSTFDYLYEFSETRKVLEEFFKCPPPTEEKDNTEFPFQVRFPFHSDTLTISFT